jgi:hypothetical protein
MVHRKAVDPLVVAFGSFGRLDGATEVSDYDTIYLYEGPRDSEQEVALRELIRNIVRSNQALLFDHRAAIEDGTFDFDSSPAYPVFAADDIVKPDAEGRAVQLLMEGRCLRSPTLHSAIAATLVRNFGYTDSIHGLNLSSFREALSRLKKAYCHGVVGRPSDSHLHLTNRKILKLFALREFSYLANLFALTEVAIWVSVRMSSPTVAVRATSAPSILKIACFGEARGALAALLEARPPAVKQAATEVAETYISKLPKGVTGVFGSSPVDADEDPFIAKVRVLTLNVLRNFDSLLELLHDLEFLEAIDALAPDVTNWMSLQQFNSVLDRRQQLIDSAKTLAAALSEILRIVSPWAGCTALQDARQSLNEILEYSLELEMPRRS